MAVDITSLTTQQLNGTGVLDSLLNTMSLHLEREFKQARIKGNDYATVYTSLLGTTMGAAVQYALAQDKTTADIALVEANIALTESQRMLVEQQILTAEVNTTKVAAETALLNQRTVTESAQTQDIADSESVLGRQIELYRNQAIGYDVDQKVKVARLFTDTANVQLTINDTYTVAGTGLEDANIQLAVDAARTSVNP